VQINEHCTGSRWTVKNLDHLAKLVAIIGMGQAIHAAKIISELQPASPAITHDSLIEAAKLQLRVSGSTQNQRDASRWRRDGYLFEAISWIAARQSSGPRAYLKDPHLKSTTQGIDGLMVELDPEKPEVTRTIIFEDKCSDNPRQKFRDEVLEAFGDHHKHARAPELVSTAAALIEKSGLDATAAVQAAASVLDLQRRYYRASLAIVPSQDNAAFRTSLFKDYEDLAGIPAEQRIGATFVTGAGLRDWFDSFAASITTALDNL
jgi:hypothetical protein